MKIAYIILAHDRPDNLARLAALLVRSGGTVVVHLDGSAGDGLLQDFQAALHPLEREILYSERVPIEWGRWSLVKATLLALEALERHGTDPDYVHLMSGSDYPIRSLTEFSAFLSRHAGTDFVEAFPIGEVEWVKGGLEHERYSYRHWFSWQRSHTLFNVSWKAQAALGLERAFLRGLRPHLGSQWWTLTWKTCRAVLTWSRSRQIEPFFRSVFIPDEMFFQTFAGNWVPESSLRRHSLTLYNFTTNGVPAVYYDDHLEYLLRQPFFFARKISPFAQRLRTGLDTARELRKHPIGDHEVGSRTAEYEHTCRAFRHGLVNRRVFGLMRNPQLGDLEWNRDPYLVLHCESSLQSQDLLHRLQASETLRLHGRLFGPDRIEFGGELRRFAGYRDDDTTLRDDRPISFLVDVVKAGLPLVTSFLLTPEDAARVGAIGIDPRARHVVLRRGSGLVTGGRASAAPVAELDVEDPRWPAKLEGYASGLLKTAALALPLVTDSSQN